MSRLHSQSGAPPIHGQDQVHRVLEQVVVGDAVGPAILRLAGAEGDGEVDVARLQGRHRGLGLVHRHGELDTGMLLGEAGDRDGHDRRRRGLEGGHPEAAPAEPGDGLELGLRLAELGEDGVGVAHDGLAGVREADAAGTALDQRGAGLALERRDLLGDGGLGEGERLGRGGERAPGGDLAQHAHTADVEHQRILYADRCPVTSA